MGIAMAKSGIEFWTSEFKGISTGIHVPGYFDPVDGASDACIDTADTNTTYDQQEVN